MSTIPTAPRGQTVHDHHNNRMDMQSRWPQVKLPLFLVLLVSTTSCCSAGIAGLNAAGPSQQHADELMLFGQFVGDWEFDYVGYTPDGKKQIGKGEWHFGWTLEGRAVQDTWIIPLRSERRADIPEGECGTTVRFYDPKIKAWRVVWSGPLQGEMSTFIARKVGDEIVMEGKNDSGKPVRWIFSKITGQSFYWHSVASFDRGKTWKLTEEMFVRRANETG